MDIQTFIQNFREAFGKNAELPLVFWYSDEQKGETEKINGCFFKGMRTVRDGGIYNRQIKKFPTEKQNVSLKHILT